MTRNVAVLATCPDWSQIAVGQNCEATFLGMMTFLGMILTNMLHLQHLRPRGSTAASLRVTRIELVISSLRLRRPRCCAHLADHRWHDAVAGGTLAQSPEAQAPRPQATDVPSPEARAHDAANQDTKAHQEDEPKAVGREKTFAEWLSEGHAQLSASENDDAVIAFSKAVDADPQSGHAFNGRGVAYLRLKKLKPALADFTKAIQLKPDEAKFYGNRALVYQLQDKFGEALADLSRAIKLEPKSPEWYEERSLVFSLMDDPVHAETDLSQAKMLKGAAKQDDRDVAAAPRRRGASDRAKRDIANAQTLQAPALGRGAMSNLKAFASEIRQLASDEFEFKDAQQKTPRQVRSAQSL